MRAILGRLALDVRENMKVNLFSRTLLSKQLTNSSKYKVEERVNIHVNMKET